MSIQVIHEIEAELSRLAVGTDKNPYSGLSAELHGEEVSLFDDYDRGFYPPDRLLAVLRELSPDQVSLDADPPEGKENIWQAIERRIFSN